MRDLRNKLQLFAVFPLSSMYPHLSAFNIFLYFVLKVYKFWRQSFLALRCQLSGSQISIGLSNTTAFIQFESIIGGLNNVLLGIKSMMIYLISIRSSCVIASVGLLGALKLHRCMIEQP